MTKLLMAEILHHLGCVKTKGFSQQQYRSNVADEGRHPLINFGRMRMCLFKPTRKNTLYIYTWNDSSTKSSWKRRIVVHKHSGCCWFQGYTKNLSKYIHLAWFCQVSRHTCQLQSYPSPTWDLSSPDTNDFSFRDVQGSTWRSRNEKAEAMYQYIYQKNLNASYFFIPYEQIQGTSPGTLKNKKHIHLLKRSSWANRCSSFCSGKRWCLSHPGSERTPKRTSLLVTRCLERFPRWR